MSSHSPACCDTPADRADKRERSFLSLHSHHRASHVPAAHARSPEADGGLQQLPSSLSAHGQQLHSDATDPHSCFVDGALWCCQAGLHSGTSPNCCVVLFPMHDALIVCMCHSLPFARLYAVLGYMKITTLGLELSHLTCANLVCILVCKFQHCEVVLQCSSSNFRLPGSDRYCLGVS